jgi:hypothetical protein
MRLDEKLLYLVILKTSPGLRPLNGLQPKNAAKKRDKT